MGREIKRVPLDFSWPMNKVWSGFINPHYRECPASLTNDCHGGATNAAQWLDAICRLISMVGEEGAQSSPEYQAHFRRTGRSYPHPYLEEWGNAPRTEVPRAEMARIREMEPMAARMRELERYTRANPPRLLALDEEIADVVRGLSGEADLGRSMGSGVAWKIQRALLKAAGKDDETWGRCKVCGGDGLDPAVKDAYEAWAPEGPPAGDGWQMWETVSEGSPVSPVFATADGLEDWLVNSERYTREGAAAFVKTGWAMSMMMTGGKMYDGIEACAPGEENDMASKERRAVQP